MGSQRQRPKKQDLEKTIERRIRAALRHAGWHTEKIHGGRFQSGLPDLYCFHRELGHRWIEIKRPKGGRLTKAQRLKFPKWESAGIGIWILTSADEIALLNGPPNWREWWTGDQRDELDSLIQSLASGGS